MFLSSAFEPRGGCAFNQDSVEYSLQRIRHLIIFFRPSSGDLGNPPQITAQSRPMWARPDGFLDGLIQVTLMKRRCPHN
jgi:hypothetical protein